MAEEELLTVEEAARRLRLSQETIRRWLREKRIRGIRLATARAGWRIPAAAVDEMLSEGRQIPLPESADQKKAAA